MVTHEPDIAAYAQRNVAMRDGVVLSDKVLPQRVDAAREMEHVKTSTTDEGESTPG
jgi:ABC-type lipoprotein export system ATPase subunit